ncbi:MAG: hypothetical protein AAF202_07665, partial [Pseudomonadota bacterium]
MDKRPLAKHFQLRQNKLIKTLMLYSNRDGLTGNTACYFIGPGDVMMWKANKNVWAIALVSLAILVQGCGGDFNAVSTKSNTEGSNAGQQNPTGGNNSSAPPSPGQPSDTNSLPPLSGYNSSDLGNACSDGIDNDGDGFTDWGRDKGCFGPNDGDEQAQPREQEYGWTTFDLPAGAKIIYVSSSDGNDSNSGLSPAQAVRTANRGQELLTDGSGDFMLLKRGDTFRVDGGLGFRGRFKSGASATRPLLVSAYGEQRQRPIVEVNEYFINDDGRTRANIAVTGLEFRAYRKILGHPNFDGLSGSAFRFVGDRSRNIIVEDNYMVHAESGFSNVDNLDFRRNTIYKVYKNDTCAYNADGSRNRNGNVNSRPSGIFTGGSADVLIEENIFDHNGWNDDAPEGCATIYNHNLYLSSTTRITLKNNLILRASSIGAKFTSSSEGRSDSHVIEGNVFAEGEIGIGIGGNNPGPRRFTNATIRNNILTDIGRSRPTDRNLSWYIGLQDHINTVVEYNLLINQPSLGNVWGIQLTNDTNSNIDIRNNLFHAMRNSNLRLGTAGSSYS